MDTKNKVFIVIGSVALIATAGISGLGLFAGSSLGKGATGHSSSSTANAAATTSAGNPSMGNSGGSMKGVAYKDGQYTASSDYYVPGGQNTVSATVTVKNGTIASVTANDNYSEGGSAYYIYSFESSISSAASGQPLNGLSLSRVGGASLTTIAFDNVLDTIRSQAGA